MNVSHHLYFSSGRMAAYIRPSDQVVGILVERTDNRVLSDKIREVDVKSVSEEKQQINL